MTRARSSRSRRTSIAAVSQLVPRNSVGTGCSCSAATQSRAGARSASNASCRRRSEAAARSTRTARPRRGAGLGGRTGSRRSSRPAGPPGRQDRRVRRPHHSGRSVDAAGSLVRNTGVSSTQKLGAGDYLVIFNQDVTPCIYAGDARRADHRRWSSARSPPTQRTATRLGCGSSLSDSAGTSTARTMPFYVAV